MRIIYNKEFYFSKLKSVIFFGISIQLIYAIIFKLINEFSPNAFHGFSKESKIIDYFYFSVITFSTTGMGDIYPLTTIARVVVASEIIFGLITVASLVYYNSCRILAVKNETIS